MRNLVWFSNSNLRVADNRVFEQACAENKPVIAVYCFDPRHYVEGNFGFKKTEKFRAKFLIESVENLRKNPQNLNIILFIFQQKPEEIIPDLVEKQDISTIFLQKEWTREEREVIENVTQKSGENVQFQAYFDQFLYHPYDIPYWSFSEISKVFTVMRKRLEQHSEVREPIQKPKRFSEGI